MVPISVMLAVIAVIYTHFLPPINGLLSRHSPQHDPYIVCELPPPLSSLPLSYHTRYANSIELCSALNGPAANVGCICHTPRSFIHCDENVADPVLYNARVPSSDFGFAAYQQLHVWCAETCWCVDADIARLARDHARSRIAAPTAAITATAAATATAQATGGVQGDAMRPLDPEGMSQVAGQAGSSTGRNWWANQCGSNCTSNADCTAGGGGCMCLAGGKGTFQPGVGSVAFAAACIVSLAAGNGNSGANAVGKGGGGGKRDVGAVEESVWGGACPCNVSYVSKSCCEVSDGLVWEGQEFKLGELVR